MVLYAVFLAFVVYALVTLRYGHHWRPLGFQPLEYIVGAIIVIGAAVYRIGWGAWAEIVFAHYVIAFAVVQTAEIVAVARKRAQARATQAELDAHREVSTDA